MTHTLTKPLHVEVAEALGTYAPSHDWEEADWINSYCRRCGYEIGHSQKDAICAPAYDTDWAATGPLLEKYRIALRPFTAGDGSNDDPVEWDAYSDAPFHGHGPTPLVATCNLILSLHRAGKLP